MIHCVSGIYSLLSTKSPIVWTFLSGLEIMIPKQPYQMVAFSFPFSQDMRAREVFYLYVMSLPGYCYSVLIKILKTIAKTTQLLWKLNILQATSFHIVGINHTCNHSLTHFSIWLVYFFLFFFFFSVFLFSNCLSIHSYLFQCPDRWTIQQCDLLVLFSTVLFLFPFSVIVYHVHSLEGVLTIIPFPI